MRVDVSPRRADVTPGQPLTVAITITNTGTVIGGYAVRMLGADPGWVEMDTGQVSLFPDETRTVTATVTVPAGIPAGTRRIAVQVRELTPPESSTVAELDLAVPAAPSVQVRLDPLAVTAGRRAAFSLVVENTGNTAVRRRFEGDDPEGKVEFAFEPETVALAPGEHAVVDMRAKARRPFVGSPAVRILGIHLDTISADPFFDDADPDRPVARTEQPAASGTFIQRPVLSRGPMALLGLLVAVSVFAVVITIAMSRLVGASTADRDLALQVAQARDAGASTGTAAVAGTVRLLTSGAAAPGVAVSVFAASDTTTPIATTATDSKGAYQVSQLAAGDYKLSFRGAGFVQLWYPAAATDADATAVTVKAGQRAAGLDVRLGGIPATISGTVVGDDVSAATLYLETGGTAAAAASAAQAPQAGALPNGTPVPPDNGSAVVRTVPIGSDGSFTLADVPSPSVYNLVVTKAAHATSTQRIDIGAGEDRKGVEIRLRKGDGLMSGHVNSATGPLPGVTITATTGQSTASTVSLTELPKAPGPTVGAPPAAGDDIGAFTLRDLPTPGSFTIVASKTNYASQTLTLSLAAGQKLTGVSITLGRSSGSLTGAVTTLPDGGAAPGVTVTVTDGQLTVQTVTESTGAVGQWNVGGLAVPGTYTVTFSRADLASQTVSVSLDSAGNITPGSQGATITAAGIAVAMRSATATVFGTISQRGATGCASTHLGEATVTLNSGTSSYTVTSASTPADECGKYRIEHVPPGTYTLTVSTTSGTSPASRVVTLQAGDSSRQDVLLAMPSSMSGTVVGTDDTLRAAWTVTLYVATQYPAVVAATTTTNSHGEFTFEDIAAGNYIVEVRPTRSSAPVASKTVTVRASTHVTVTITADPDG